MHFKLLRQGQGFYFTPQGVGGACCGLNPFLLGDCDAAKGKRVHLFATAWMICTFLKVTSGNILFNGRRGSDLCRFCQCCCGSSEKNKFRLRLLHQISINLWRWIDWKCIDMQPCLLSYSSKYNICCRLKLIAVLKCPSLASSYTISMTLATLFSMSLTVLIPEQHSAILLMVSQLDWRALHPQVCITSSWSSLILTAQQIGSINLNEGGQTERESADIEEAAESPLFDVKGWFFPPYLLPLYNLGLYFVYYVTTTYIRGFAGCQDYFSSPHSI